MILHPTQGRGVSPWLCLFVAACLMFMIGGCGDSKAAAARAAADQAAQREREAIKRMFAVDGALAAVRDRELGDKSDLAVISAAVQKYTSSLAAVDMHDLPADMQAAYAKHVELWRRESAFFDHYSGLTGQFRVTVDGKDYVKSQYLAMDKAMTDSWNEVKATAKAHGVEPPAN